MPSPSSAVTRILFVNAIDPTRLVERGFGPLGMGYLISALRAEFGNDAFEFKVVDTEVEKAIRFWHPHIVGISSVSQNYNIAMRYAEVAKASGASVMVGGVHISMIPRTLSEHMDVGVVGEGEVTICELMRLFRERNGWPPEHLRAVRGIVFRSDGHLVQTPPRAPIRTLNSLPLPAREFLHIGERAYMFTSRGCPNRCVFCASSRFWGDDVRTFSPTYIANEIEHLVVKYGVREISFLDDIFLSDAVSLEALIGALWKRGLLGSVRFNCSLRADIVTPALVGRLKALGVQSVGIGFESGSQRMLSYLKGPKATVEGNARAVALIRAQGIRVGGSFIIGSPWEKCRDALETLSFVKDHKLTSFDIYQLTPFPGTPVWSYAHSRGLVSDRMDWSRLDVVHRRGRAGVINLSERMTQSEIDDIFDRFERLRKRWAATRLMRTALRHPQRVPGYVLRRLGQWVRM